MRRILIGPTISPRIYTMRMFMHIDTTFLAKRTGSFLYYLAKRRGSFLNQEIKMDRFLTTHLKEWFHSTIRKPLVIRGARQVGKTWLVRYFSELMGQTLIEVNLEKQPQLISLFNSNDPRQILINLGVAYNQTITPERHLLFIDEIQVAPEIFAKLRWFAEDLPELAVVAAGSLLDFMLAERAFSVPVGRITYMYLEPFSFEEFLLASKKLSLTQYLTEYCFSHEIPVAIHEELTQIFKEYLIIGGMPAAVLNWVNQRTFSAVSQIHHDLLTTYRDDFAKYRGRLSIEKVAEVMNAIPSRLGEKFVYSRVAENIHTGAVKEALNVLEKAKICHSVKSVAANGIPLGAEIREKYFKEIFLDVGLVSATLGLTLNQLRLDRDITLVNKGGLAEQVVGQILRTLFPAYEEPALYCWHREEKGSNAEIDYVIQYESTVVPIEVKAGSEGSLKSLHLFMGLKNYSVALRVNSNCPIKKQIKVKNSFGKVVEYSLFSIPFYLLGQAHRLLSQAKL